MRATGTAKGWRKDGVDSDPTGPATTASAGITPPLERVFKMSCRSTIGRAAQFESVALCEAARLPRIGHVCPG